MSRCNNCILEDISKKLFFILLILLVTMFFVAILIKGIDRGIENQDQMLCESAKISGNKKYLKKCECYYQTEDIKCLQK